MSGKGTCVKVMEYSEVKFNIKKYTRNKRFIRRVEDEKLVIESKYFGMSSSSVLGTPNGSQQDNTHALASIGQEKLDELNDKYGARYDKAKSSVAYVDGLLKRLPKDISGMIIHTYIQRKYVDELALKYNCTRATIYNRINAAIIEDCSILD